MCFYSFFCHYFAKIHFPSSTSINSIFQAKFVPETEAEKQRKYIEHNFDRLRRIHGVENVIVFNTAGVLLQTSFNRSESIPIIGLFNDLIIRAKRAMKTLDCSDGLTTMRLKTLKFEILITLDSNDLIFIVFQVAKGMYI